MNKAEKALKALLEPLMSEHGFKPVSSHLGFRRRTDFGFQCLLFTGFAWRTGGPYVVNAGLGVRHDLVDEIVNQLGHIWGSAGQKNTTTVFRGLEFFPFNAQRDGRKVITSERLEMEALGVVSDVSAMLKGDGFGFLQTYSDILACSNGLNTPVQTRTHQLCNNFPLRAYYGIVTAALTQTERVPTLIQQYIDFAQESGWGEMMMYEVGKELSGIDAFAARLEFLAETGLASAR